MTAQSRVFESGTKSWEEMCAEVCEFATQVGKERVINISVAAAGAALGGRGIIVVWYWE
jgi:hypothetical protein